MLATHQQISCGGLCDWVEVHGQDKGICTVASLGLRDCGVLAWRVRGDDDDDVVGEVGGFFVEVAGEEEEEEEEEDEDEEEEEEEDGEEEGNGNGNGYWEEEDGELEMR